MTQIIFKYKGLNEIYLTREYNSLSTFTADKDDVGFNESQNQFSNFCANSTCGNWQNDKIIIKSLPDKGRLFYVTNPNQNQPLIYADVFIGQVFIMRDLEDLRVLKFNAEGAYNNQYSDSYITSFTFERYCGTTASNKKTVVTLNMVDTMVAPSILPTAVVSQNAEGTNTNSIYNNTLGVYLYGSQIQAYSGATVVSAIWQYRNISESGIWIDDNTAIEGSAYPYGTYYDDFEFRIKVTDSNGLVGYSNVLSKYYSQSLLVREVTVHSTQNLACQSALGSGNFEHGLVGFTSTTPQTGDVAYSSQGSPYTGSFAYITIFNYGDVYGDNRVYQITGGTGVLGSRLYCN